MPGPVENRSLNELSKVKRARRAARKPTKREHHQERVRTMVTWVLVFVFSVTSVGLLISMRQATTVTDRQTAADQAAQSADRIDALERKARENPKDASWQFQLAQAYAESRDVVNQEKALKETLRIDPSHPQALLLTADIHMRRNEPGKAEKVLETGIAAEKEEVARLNKARPAEEPEIMPDALLRAALFQALLSQGASRDADARAAARDGLTVQPIDFVKALQNMSLQWALMMQRKDLATRAMRISLEEAKAMKDTQAVSDIQKLQKMIASIQMAPPQPVRTVPGPGATVVPSPMAESPTAPGAEAAPPVPAPASPQAPPAATP